MIFQDNEKFYIITEYFQAGELFGHLQKNYRYSEKRTKFYLAELIEAIEFAHKNDIIFRDLKPRNILLNNDGHLIISDFGLDK